MTDMDALAEQHYKAYDPQFQRDDAVDKELLIYKIQTLYEIIDDAQGAVSALIDMHDSRTIRRIRNLLQEAQDLIEEEM